MEPAVKRSGGKPYHHGDLETALIDAAIAMIAEAGVEALSIRNVGMRVGVSRNALYRHFDSKAALLARVAASGFDELRRQLTKALEQADKRGMDPLVAIAGAYVRFGVSYSPQYRVMFGPALPNWVEYEDLRAAATATFGVLLETIASQQRNGRLIQADTMSLAQVVWAQVHGIVVLGMDGQLSHKNVKTRDLGRLAQFAIHSLQSGILAQIPDTD